MMAVRDSASLRGDLRLNEPLSRYTTWRVGGPARRMYLPADSSDLVNYLSLLDPDEPLLWLGLGSNLLVRDGGFDGTVIYTQGCLVELAVEKGSLIRAEAGVSCAKVARFAVRQGLCGVEFLAGIPGTLGGALAMNAGAFGSETWDRVKWVRTVDRSGNVRIREPGDFVVGYRTVTGPAHEWFIAAGLSLTPGDAAAGQEKIRQLLDKRNATQPTGLPSCGSVFRNPPGDHAARLIESAGLKGFQIGGARISDKHANFIINTGNASALDIERLIEYIGREVKEVSGVKLEPEVRIVGDKGVSS